MNNVELPHDIRGLVPYSDIMMWVLTTLAVVLVGLLAAWWWQRRRGKDRGAVVEEPKELVRVRVRRVLAMLTAEEPFSRREQQQYFFSLSMLLREYIEDTLMIPATDRTVPELGRALKKAPLVKAELSAAMLQFSDTEATVADAGEARRQVLGWCDTLDDPMLTPEVALGNTGPLSGDAAGTPAGGTPS